MNIEIINLSKSYKALKALDNVSITIRPGIHGFLGPNGAGKTTLLRILATISTADEGEIKWGDRYNWESVSKIKGNIGYLPQQFGMYKFLQVEEALKNIAVLKNIPIHQEHYHVQLAMERTNLLQIANRKVGSLSGGMLRRLGIAQAILGEPNLLIFDEPSVGLDPVERIKFRKLIRSYSNGERIILISSHIVDDLESLCDDITVLNRGKVLLSGDIATIQNVAKRYVFEDEMSEADFRMLEQMHQIINFSNTRRGYRVRYLANPDNKGTCVHPTLEDSYTFIIQQDSEI